MSHENKGSKDQYDIQSFEIMHLKQIKEEKIKLLEDEKKQLNEITEKLHQMDMQKMVQKNIQNANNSAVHYLLERIT